MTKLSEMYVKPLRGYITLREAAERLGWSRPYIYKRAADGVFSSLVRVGTSELFLVEEYEIETLRRSREATRPTDSDELANAS